jgi:protein ImuB
MGLEALGVELLSVASESLLPEDRSEGETLQQLIERLSARLGAERVLHGEAVADHRPQQMQRWESATVTNTRKTRRKPVALPGSIGLQPPWILRQPMRLAVVRERPVYQGPLVLLAGPDRLETGWWINDGAKAQPDDLNLRDYFVAESEHAGLLWIYRQRAGAQPGWYLHGIYG